MIETIDLKYFKDQKHVNILKVKKLGESNEINKEYLEILVVLDEFSGLHFINITDIYNPKPTGMNINIMRCISFDFYGDTYIVIKLICILR